MNKKEPEIAGAAPFLGISLPSALANTILFCSQVQLLFHIPHHFDLYALRHVLERGGCPTDPCPYFESHKTLLLSFLYVLNVFVSNVYFYEKRSNYFGDDEAGEFPSMRIVGSGLWGLEDFMDLFVFHSHHVKYKAPFCNLLYVFKKALKQKNLSPEKAQALYLKLQGFISCGDPLFLTGMKSLRRALPHIECMTHVVAQASGNCIYQAGT